MEVSLADTRISLKRPNLFPPRSSRCSQSRPFYKRRSSSPISLGNAFPLPPPLPPVHPIELYHYTSIASVSTDRLRDGLLARRLYAFRDRRPSTTGNRLMTSICVTPRLTKYSSPIGTTLGPLTSTTPSDWTDLINRVTLYDYFV